MKKTLRILVAVPITLLALAPYAVASESPKSAGTVTAVSGQVTVARPAVAPQPLKFRDVLLWRDIVESRKNSIARVLLAGKTTVTVRELSRLELRQRTTPDGVRYTAELMAGKVRTSVARRLMRPGEHVRVRTRNVVASVRGTDFIVETLELPSHARAFGLLGVREVAQGIGDSVTGLVETVVLTLSGLVEVSNPLAGTGRVVQIGPYQGVRVSGRLSPVRFEANEDDLRVYLRGLTPARPDVPSGDKSDAVGNKVEKVAVTRASNGLALGHIKWHQNPATHGLGTGPAALPPGLKKKEGLGLPYGLAKREELPPGLDVNNLPPGLAPRLPPPTPPPPPPGGDD